MLSVSTAQKLKEAGLTWQPNLHDFFTIPDSDLAERVFVLSDVFAYMSILQGLPAVTFHGSMEWALDYIWESEVVWLPTEAQLREAIEKRLLTDPQASVSLQSTRDGYLCQLTLPDSETAHRFEAFGAAEAYALALIYLLQADSAR